MMLDGSGVRMAPLWTEPSKELGRSKEPNTMPGAAAPTAKLGRVPSSTEVGADGVAGSTGGLSRSVLSQAAASRRHRANVPARAPAWGETVKRFIMSKSLGYVRRADS